MKVLFVDSGAPWGIAEVDAGLFTGLHAFGVELIRYRLDLRIPRAQRYLMGEWRHIGRPVDRKPTSGDVTYHAAKDVLIKALRDQVDVVVVVAGLLFHPDMLILLRRAGVHVVLLLTESPYEVGRELEYAAYASGCWTTERSILPQLREINTHAGYLQHGWHPSLHRPDPQPGDDQVPAHDVVFVGSGFADRIAWLEAVDWTGINLGLYGPWPKLRRGSPLRTYLHQGAIPNTTAAALYRRARLGLNLYRTRLSLGTTDPRVTGDSCNPRAYEMAACGLPHISSYRPEVAEVFGDLVPTVTTPDELGAAVHQALDDEERQQRGAALVQCVADASWNHRAAIVLADLQGLTSAAA